MPKNEAATGQEITEEDIRRRAYEISQEQGAGDDEENWLRAERELREEAAAPKRKSSASQSKAA
jgi:hypothetical protein